VDATNPRQFFERHQGLLLDKIRWKLNSKIVQSLKKISTQEKRNISAI